MQFSRSFMSDSLWPHGLQHGKPPCPSPTPGVHSNSCPLSRWCHPTISSSVIPFSRSQSSPTSRSFQMTQFFTAGSQSIGASVSASVLTMNIQSWFLSGLTGWFPCCPRDCQEYSPVPQFKNISSSALSLFYGPTLTSVYDYWKNHSFESVLESFLHFVLNEKQTENSDWAVWSFMLSLEKS